MRGIWIIAMIWGQAGVAQTTDPQAFDAGHALYATNCASCHGINLEGQPDWRRRLDNGRMPAPPHDASGHTWHHSYEDLFAITKGGLGAVLPGYESNMPAFADTLTDAEIREILDFIASTWPPRQRAFFDEVSRNAVEASQWCPA